MGLADRLRDSKEKKKLNRTTEETLRDTFNEASTTLINQFMAQVISGSIQIDDVADLTRLFQIYLQINNINQGVGDGNGTLPSLPNGQKEIISSVLETEKVSIDGEVEEVISLEELAKLSDEEVDKMLAQKEIQMNQENEATF